MKKLFSLFSMLMMLSSNVLPAFTYANSESEELAKEILTEQLDAVFDLWNLSQWSSITTNWIWNEEIKTTATIIPWPNFNTSIKSLVNNGVNNNTYFNDNNIKKFKKYEWENIPNNKIIISTDWSEKPVYAWYNNSEETVYYFSEADIIYFNEDSSTMFRNFKVLNEINFKEFDLSRVENMEAIFYGFWLKKLDLSFMDLRNVTNTNYMFQSNNQLEEVDFEWIIMSWLEQRGYNSMFYDIQSLKIVDLSWADFRSLKSANQMFYNCDHLTWINLAYSNFSEVTSSSSMFYGITLDELNLSHADFRKLTSIDYFWDTKNIDLSFADFSSLNMTQTVYPFSRNLININFEGTDFSSLTSMRYWFQDKDNLKSVNFSWTILSSLENMSNMFQSNDGLNYVDFSHTDLSNVKTMKEMFRSNNWITWVNFSWCNLSKLEDAQEMFNSANALKSVNFYKADLRSLKNTKYMFQPSYWYTNLKMINFEEAVLWENMRYMFNSIRQNSNTIINFSWADFSRVRNMEYTFNYGLWIWEINFTNLKWANNITWMKYMFYDNETLTWIDLSSFDFSNVEDMSYMFQYCKSLRSIDFWNSKTEKLKNTSHMFQDCYSITWIDLSSFDFSNVEDMSYMFQYGRSLRSVNFWNSKTVNLKDMSHMFEECNMLAPLDLSNFDTEKVTNMNSVFRSCNSLTWLDLSTFKTNNVSDMGYIFIMIDDFE